MVQAIGTLQNVIINKFVAWEEEGHLRECDDILTASRGLLGLSTCNLDVSQGVILLLPSVIHKRMTKQKYYIIIRF